MSQRRARPHVLWEFFAIAWLYVIYDYINGLSPTRKGAAISHGQSLLRVETVLHIDIERSLNTWLDANRTIALVIADYYDVAHLVVTFIVLALVWWFAGAQYPQLRNALVIINVVGFFVFWLYPVAPPRLLPGTGFVDIVASTHAIWAWHSGDLAAHANDYAAMPSLHLAWAAWCAVAIWQTCQSTTLRALGVTHVVLTTYAVLATGNHYLLDVVAGLGTAWLAFVVAARLSWRAQNAWPAAEPALAPAISVQSTALEGP